MKRISSLLLLGLAAGNIASARPVSQQTALNVAAHFMATRTSSPQKNTLQLLATYTKQRPGTTDMATCYVFDVNNKSGFVVVAADDIVKPILAYSTSNEFQTGEAISPETAYWMGLYRDQIAFAAQHNLAATAEAAAEWAYYLDETGHTAAKPTAGVSPMLTTTWDQGTYYNIYTPGTGSTKTPVGCVATAMAQIMKYWDAPTTGTGSYSYNHNTYGVQSADFGATSYQWGLMPNTLTNASPQASKNAVSLLGYHCAVAVRMDFDPSGSGSQVLAWSNNSRCAENAFKNNFGYKTSINGVYREDYSDAQWDALLKTELDNARPVLYAGYGAVGGHAFVFDGYDDNDMFHINWGWGGMSNGYFTVDNLAPSALGIGGGGGNFNDGQQALIKIEPATPGDTLNMVMNGALDISTADLIKGAPFSVTTNLLNRGTFDFSGILAAAVYREADSSLAGYVQYMNNQIMMAGDDTTITFASNGISAMIAGNYFIKVLYRPVNAEGWQVMPDDMGFINRVNVTVTDTTTPPPTGISAAALAGNFNVHPNPASDRLIINISGFSGHVQAVQLFNIQGQKVASISIDRNDIPAIGVSELAAGLYYVNIITDQGTAVKKAVIRH